MLSDKRIAPKFIILEDHELRRITRATLCFELGKTPAEIDALPITDIGDLVAVYKHREIMRAKERGLKIEG